MSDIEVHRRKGGEVIELRREAGGQHNDRPVRLVDGDSWEPRSDDDHRYGGHCVSHHEDHVSFDVPAGWTITAEGEGEHELASGYHATACPRCLGSRGEPPTLSHVQTFLSGHWGSIKRDLREEFAPLDAPDPAKRLVELDDQLHELRETVADLQAQIDDLERRATTSGEKRTIPRASDLGDRR